MQRELETRKIENELGRLLNPVMPSRDFINDLNENLREKASIIVEYPDYVLPLIVISGGLFLGVLLIWGLARLFSKISGGENNNNS